MLGMITRVAILLPISVATAVFSVFWVAADVAGLRNCDGCALAFIVGQLTNQVGADHLRADGQSTSLVNATQTVLNAITAAARDNKSLPRQPSASNGPVHLTGDQLTEHLIRRAAVAAKELPTEVAAKAFLLGLGAGLDDSRVLRDNPLTGGFIQQVESDDQRKARLSVLGKPTVRGRRDLAKHFAVSLALTVQLGPQTAEALGILKEVRDAHGGTGFSFVDLQADLAGILFASQIQKGHPSFDALATSFTLNDVMPPTDGLQEGLPWEAFTATYGSTQDDRFLRQVSAIRKRILALSPPKNNTIPHKNH